MKIVTKCPDCGKEITILVHKVTRLEQEIEYLKRELAEATSVNKLRDIFGWSK